MAASEAQLLAPQEILGAGQREKGARGELIGAEERTETDRKRERRKKKAKQGAIFRSVTEVDFIRGMRCVCKYRVILMVLQLGWDDLDLRCSTILFGQ